MRILILRSVLLLQPANDNIDYYIIQMEVYSAAAKDTIK